MNKSSCHKDTHEHAGKEREEKLYIRKKKVLKLACAERKGK